MQALIATLKSKLKSRQEWRRGDQAHLVAPAGSPVFAAAPLHAPLQANVAPSTVSPVVATSEPAGSLIETSTEDTLTVAELPESSTDSDVIAIFDGVKDPEKLQRQQDLWPETVTLSTSALSRADAGSLNVKGDKKDQAERAEKQEFVAMVTTTVEFATLEHGSGLTPASVADLDFIANQEVISTKGLSLSHLHELADMWGGPETLKGKTTSAFCAEFIIPMMSDSQLSVVNHYLTNLDTEHLVHDAHWFISHAWMNPFLDLLDALDHFFAEKHIPASEAYIWLDILSTSQTVRHHRVMDWLVDVIRPIKNVVIVLEPWIDPIPLKRSWCILELYFTRLTDANFHVALPEAQTNDFMNAFRKDPAEFHKILKNVSCEKSETSVPQDRDIIFDLVKSKVGFSKLDQMVFSVFESWISSHLQAKIDKVINPAESWNWQASLGQFYRLTGDYDSAAVMLKKAYLAAQQQFGLQDSKTLAILADLGEAYMRGGNYADAETMLAKAIVSGTKAYSEDHPVVLMNLDTLANIQRRLGKFDMAEMLMQRCLKARTSVLGPEHPQTLSSLNNMAAIYQMQGRLKEAEANYFQAIESGSKVLGQEHFQVQEALGNLASLYSKQGRYDEAQSLLEPSLDLLCRKIGEDSLSTRPARHNLAYAYFKQGKYCLAQKLHKFNMNIIENHSKEQTQDGLNTLSHLAAAHYALGDLSTAEEMLLQWMELYPGVIPEKHQQTLLARDRLGQVYIAQNRLKEAEVMCVKTLDILKDSYGHDHGQTLDATATLAELRWKQNRGDETRNLLEEVIEGKERVFGKDHLETRTAIALLHERFPC